jgi:taurine dioxygenase
MSFRHIHVHPISASLGAVVEGVDLAKLANESVFKEVHQAFLDHAVLLFRDQNLSHEDQIAFGRRFGELDIHPIAIGMEDHPEVLRVLKPAGERASFGTSWHTDNTFFERPSMASILYGATIPPYGGDTLYASSEKAYDALSDTMKKMLDGLQAVHSASRAYDPATTGEAKYKGEAAINYKFSEAVHEENTHPVIRTHPETGRKSIFVNPMFTLRIAGLSEAEGAPLLQFLFRHTVRPEFTCRVQWEPGTLLLWDNRCTQHYALDDYPDSDRLMFRVSVAGDRPA